MVLLSACSTQYVPPPTASSTSIINNDQTIQGVLDNGLKYVIHQQKNTKKVQFNLVAFTGGAYEEPNQKGAAHFLEHLAFRKTKQFSDRAIIQFIEQQGGEFGNEINASTSAYYTDYRFELEDNKQVPMAISILGQWSQNIVINQEIRPVILGEWRRRVGIENSWWQQTQTWFYQQWLNLTRREGYINRDALGNPAQITHLSADILSKFYKKWYRPDNMAIVIIGNIEPKELENQLVTVFSKWQNPTQPLVPKQFDSVDQGITTSYGWDLNSSGIYLGFKQHGNSNLSEIVLHKLYFYLLELRLLAAINHSHNTNILDTYIVKNSVENQTSTTTLMLSLNNTKQQPAFDLLQQVLASMRNNSFSLQELNLSKNIVAQQLYSAAQLQVDNGDLSNEIITIINQKMAWHSPIQYNSIY
ncbi:MAG: insulinase family protein [Gammaproteobacteria bacterium]|nr:insulinase family protein [Gammaproteobacteria bacterium]